MSIVKLKHRIIIDIFWVSVMHSFFFFSMDRVIKSSRQIILNNENYQNKYRKKIHQ